jgi:hypothetical protein
MRWLISCLRCGHSWRIETQQMEKGLPPARSAKCPKCHDDTLMYKKCELLPDSPQKQDMNSTNAPTHSTDSPAIMNTIQDAEKKVVTILPIPRDAVEHPTDVTRDTLERIVGGFAAMCVEEKRLRRITLTISGYDDDPRELYEIPEVCAWARDAYKSLPSLWFFLDAASRDRFIGWLCGPVARKNIESSDFLQQLNNKRIECAGVSIASSSGFFERAGASKEMVSAFYFQELGKRAGTTDVKKWWQFWK